MFGWLRARRKATQIPDAMWQAVIDGHPFLARLDEAQRLKLRELAQAFLATKEFTGVHGAQVDDSLAVSVAAQAALPVLTLGLSWYDDFVGIVIHPGDAVARRTRTDENGVVHQYDEVLAGEAMQGGPVMLSLEAVRNAAETAPQGYNLVIHEFAHKIDMRDGAADGCPPLPAGFMGAASAVQARERWLACLEAEFSRFSEEVTVAERFGGKWPWLDDYAATAIDEFFAVTCEAYFVNRSQFKDNFPALLPMYEAFFGV